MNCYVLAGGRSTRMGESKAHIAFAGTTFLGRMVEAASSVFDRVVAVQRQDGETLRGIETICESAHAFEAPLFAVQRALEHANGRAIVVAVDYPLMTPDVLRFLRSRFEATAAPALVPEWNGRLQVLCAGYSAELLPAIERRVVAKRFDLKSILADAEIIPERELRARFAGEPLMNVNTPDELEEARRFYDKQQQGLLASR